MHQKASASFSMDVLVLVVQRPDRTIKEFVGLSEGEWRCGGQIGHRRHR